jgi:hypothetical protein
MTDIERGRAEKALREYCARKLRPDIRHELEIVYRIAGRFAILSERRPDWQNRSVYRDHDVAKFRFDMAERKWVLLWRDRNLRWHRFENSAPATDIAELLPVVDAEPIFYG